MGDNEFTRQREGSLRCQAFSSLALSSEQRCIQIGKAEQSHTKTRVPTLASPWLSRRVVLYIPWETEATSPLPVFPRGHASTQIPRILETTEQQVSCSPIAQIWSACHTDRRSNLKRGRHIFRVHGRRELE